MLYATLPLNFQSLPGVVVTLRRGIRRRQDCCNFCNLHTVVVLLLFLDFVRSNSLHSLTYLWLLTVENKGVFIRIYAITTSHVVVELVSRDQDLPGMSPLFLRGLGQTCFDSVDSQGGRGGCFVAFSTRRRSSC